MTVLSAILFLAIVAAAAYVAHWVITTFFPEPVRTPALILVGVVLLIVLVSQFVPDAGNYRLWR